ncbi:hypothetical protein QKW35_19990 [Pontibacterium granulatum]|uniref:hypothetical protein n=1 Tax=Pontibacterium granulatum TaxID=2036029 RepID=UPI00249CE9B7|nr:hypothetical protein [Pontibacterium granulatum]MDI3326663.1 hypothetical protein [Pontibacterium granulatum]
MKLTHAERFDSWLFEEHPQGKYFACPEFAENLSNIHVLMSSVDTVRQLYRGTIDPEWYAKLESDYEAARLETRIVHIHGYDFVVRPGGSSGFKFRLQNNDEGLIIFVKSHYAKENFTGTHVKIECSPKLLLTTEPTDVQDAMDGIARTLLDGDMCYGGVALHLAVDVQGYTPAQDFDKRLVCRSSRQFTHDGIDRAEIDLASASVTYGKGETYTFGSVTALQLCHYNKSKEIIRSDKREFMHAAWSGEFSGAFHPAHMSFDPEGGEVWRLEMRFSHQVLNQFHDGFQSLPDTSVKDLYMKSYADAFGHLSALWEYALSQFQLPRGKFYAPEWTLFMKDANFNQHHQDVIYKRVYKEPGIDNARNVALALGNILSIHARHGYSAQASWKFLKNTGIWDDVLGYIQQKGISKSEFFDNWRDRLLERRMIGKAA